MHRVAPESGITLPERPFGVGGGVREELVHRALKLSAWQRDRAQERHCPTVQQQAVLCVVVDDRQQLCPRRAIPVVVTLEKVVPERALAVQAHIQAAAAHSGEAMGERGPLVVC